MAEGPRVEGVTAFPLTAMVGCGDVAEALACALCRGEVRSVLVCGPAGSGKTVAVRGAAALSGRRTVELPLNATAEQVFGTIDVDEALATGRRRVSDSVMRRAHGNVLVADNVNLLPKGILQCVLDAVETRTVRAEMEGTSVCERCDTVLLATMDPAEAELSRHELDRFDICVWMPEVSDPADRREIVRRAMRFSASPRAFREEHSGTESAFAERVASADADAVSFPEGLMAAVQAVCTAMGADGHRGDVAVVNTACALAALDGRNIATGEDVAKAVRLCLLHRGRLPDQEEDATDGSDDVSEMEVIVEESDTDVPDKTPDEPENVVRRPAPAEASSGGPSGTDMVVTVRKGFDGPETVFEIGETFEVRDFLPADRRPTRDRDSGRRGLMLSRDSNGRCIGYEIPRGRPKDIALGATIRVAAPYQAHRDRGDRAIAIENSDLRDKVRVRRKGAKMLFVVDGSGSMDAQRRMVAVKGTILSILQEAYRRRDRVGLVVFRGDEAEEVMPMSRSVLTARKILEDLPVGGRTPLTSGLRMGYDILRRYAADGEEPVMIVMTDGWGNVNVNPKVRPREELERTCGVIARSGIHVVVIDTEPRGSRFRKAPKLAEMLGGECLLLEEMDARSLSETVTGVLEGLEPAKSQNTR